MILSEINALSHAARYRREQGRRVFVRQMVRQMALSLCPRTRVTNAQGPASRTRKGLDVFVYMQFSNKTVRSALVCRCS